MLFAIYAAALAAFLFALNGRLRARTVRRWQFAMLATEFGAPLATIPLAVAVSAVVAGGWPGVPAAMLATLAAAWLVCPVVMSRRLRRRLRHESRDAFGPAAVPAPSPAHARALPGAGVGRRLLASVLGVFCRLRPVVPMREYVYAGDGGVARRLLFYPVQGSTSAPCLVVLHTGGWESGAPDEFAGCHAALARAGIAVAAIEYGLTPKYAWPTPREDLRAAIAWLKNHAPELGISPADFVLLGRSAGGQVALCAAYDKPDPAIRGVAAFYAPTDMVFSWRGSYEGDMIESPKLLANYLGGRPHETPEIHADASPSRHAAAGDPVPTLLLHGWRDDIVWCLQARRLARVLRSRGTRHLAVIVPWAKHGFDFRLRGPGGRVAWETLTAFVAAVTRR